MNENDRKTDDIILDESGVTEYYKKGAGCTKVTIFPRMPYEGTGHIDMWAKFLDNDTVMVNELRQEIVDLEWYTDEERGKVKEIQAYLEARSSDIRNLGFKLIRIPMPAPVFSYYAYTDATQKKLVQYPDVFRSYTNSITVNGTAVTPRYQAIDANGGLFDAATNVRIGSMPIKEAYPDAALVQSYEDEARAAYESLGYRMNFVTVDNLISIGGAVHCVTMQIAKNPNRL